MSNHYEYFHGLSTDCTLPINNGRELDGDSFVIDFESTHFMGTLLLRIKQAPRLDHGEKIRSKECNKDVDALVDQRHENDYFANKKRTFHAIIKGRFKKPLSMSQCVTGQVFERPAGKLPAKWMVTNILNFFSILAPQLDASLDGNQPRFLSPLVATAHTVLSEDDDDSVDVLSNSKDTKTNEAFHLQRINRNCFKIDTRIDIKEPSSLESCSILSSLSCENYNDIRIPDTTSSSGSRRVMTRKRIFNTLSANKSSEPRFDESKVYTFEFYQHLLNFGDQLALDMGRIGGKFPIAQALDGQPLKIMGAYRTGEENKALATLWSFDVFHESLYPYAELALKGN